VPVAVVARADYPRAVETTKVHIGQLADIEAVREVDAAASATGAEAS
jgi:hypothetical protein